MIASSPSCEGSTIFTPPIDHDVERVAQVALVEDHLVAAESATAHEAGKHAQASVVDVGKERAASRLLTARS